MILGAVPVIAMCASNEYIDKIMITDSTVVEAT